MAIVTLPPLKLAALLNVTVLLNVVALATVPPANPAALTLVNPEPSPTNAAACILPPAPIPPSVTMLPVVVEVAFVTLDEVIVPVTPSAPPTFKFPLMPAPPVTTTVPVVELLDATPEPNTALPVLSICILTLPAPSDITMLLLVPSMV